jgi:hypothetical protein
MANDPLPLAQRPERIATLERDREGAGDQVLGRRVWAGRAASRGSSTVHDWRGITLISLSQKSGNLILEVRQHKQAFSMFQKSSSRLTLVL